MSIKIKVYNGENSKQRERRKEREGEREEEARELPRKYVNILIIFINSIINKTAGRFRFHFIRKEIEAQKSLLLSVFKHQQLKTMYFGIFLNIGSETQ